MLIILISFLNFSSSINNKFHNNTNKMYVKYVGDLLIIFFLLSDISRREKRQTINFFIHDHEDVPHSESQIQSKLFTEEKCSYKSLDDSCLSDALYRTFDGSCNNLLNPWWGTTNIPFQRLMKANYADGTMKILTIKIKLLVFIKGEFLPRNLSVTGLPLASPREISNICSNEMMNITEREINSFFTIFAQFIDHDLSNAANGKDDEHKQIHCQCEEDIKNPFCINIPTVDMSDQLCMLFPRSSALFQRETACQLSKWISEEKNNLFFVFPRKSFFLGDRRIYKVDARL